MASATKVTARQTEQLLKWMQQNQPHVYRGLVRRFTPKVNGQMSGIFDSIASVGSNLIGSVTNFFNSQGGQSLLTAAQPFIQNKIEKQQLELNIKRLQAGQPPVTYQLPAGATQESTPGTWFPVGPDGSRDIPWGWIAGGVGLVLVLTMRK